MELTINLEDPKFCEGCLACNNTQNFCAAGYWGDTNTPKPRYEDGPKYRVIRPERCISENGWY